MKFESEKGVFLGVVIVGSAILILGVTVPTIFRDVVPLFLYFLINLPVAGLLFWIWFDTHYTISNGQLFYASGPFRGKIDIQEIRKISLNQSFYAGLKPALATKGIVIEYNRFDDIYISPKAKEAFIQELLRINPQIEVQR